LWQISSEDRFLAYFFVVKSKKKKNREGEEKRKEFYMNTSEVFSVIEAAKRITKVDTPMLVVIDLNYSIEVGRFFRFDILDNSNPERNYLVWDKGSCSFSEIRCIGFIKQEQIRFLIKKFVEFM
jgi:hypothetical protein